MKGEEESGREGTEDGARGVDGVNKAPFDAYLSRTFYQGLSHDRQGSAHEERGQKEKAEGHGELCCEKEA